MGGEGDPEGLTRRCRQVDRTEVVRSSLDLVFSKAFTLGYCFEEVQKLRSEVYDAHGPSSLSCRGDNFLGGVECTLGQVTCVLTEGTLAFSLISEPVFSPDHERWEGP
nr:copine-7-like [Vicugna pacos]